MANVTNKDLDLVRAAAVKVGKEVAGLVGNQPAFAIAALSLAIAQIAVIADQPIEEVVEMLRLHYEAAAVGEALERAKEQGGVLVRAPEGEPS